MKSEDVTLSTTTSETGLLQVNQITIVREEPREVFVERQGDNKNLLWIGAPRGSLLIHGAGVMLSDEEARHLASVLLNPKEHALKPAEFPN